jgi:hypothetical protein
MSGKIISENVFISGFIKMHEKYAQSTNGLN